MEMKLYEIAEAVTRMEELCEDQAGLTEYLDQAKLDLKEKAANVVRFRQYLTTRAEAIGTEIKRLSDLQKSLLRGSDNIEGYITYVMQKSGLDRIETDIANISFRKSETLDVVDESLVPNEYKTQVITNKVDKIAIKKDIKTGKEIPGVVLTQHQNLQIK